MDPVNIENGVAEDSLQIAAGIFEIIHNERELPEESVRWFLDHVYEEASDAGRALFDLQMQFRDLDDLAAPFASMVDGELIPIFTLLFSRRDDLEPEPLFDVSTWGVHLDEPNTWVEANKVAMQFGTGWRPPAWTQGVPAELSEPEPEPQPKPKPKPKPKEPVGGPSRPPPVSKPSRPPVTTPKPPPPERESLPDNSRNWVLAGGVLGLSVLGFVTWRMMQDEQAN